MASVDTRSLFDTLRTMMTGAGVPALPSAAKEAIVSPIIGAGLPAALTTSPYGPALQKGIAELVSSDKFAASSYTHDNFVGDLTQVATTAFRDHLKTLPPGEVYGAFKDVKTLAQDNGFLTADQGAALDATFAKLDRLPPEIQAKLGFALAHNNHLMNNLIDAAASGGTGPNPLDTAIDALYDEDGALIDSRASIVGDTLVMIGNTPDKDFGPLLENSSQLLGQAGLMNGLQAFFQWFKDIFLEGLPIETATSKFMDSLGVTGAQRESLEGLTNGIGNFIGGGNGNYWQTYGPDIAQGAKGLVQHAKNIAGFGDDTSFQGYADLEVTALGPGEVKAKFLDAMSGQQNITADMVMGAVKTADSALSDEMDAISANVQLSADFGAVVAKVRAGTMTMDELADKVEDFHDGLETGRPATTLTESVQAFRM